MGMKDDGTVRANCEVIKKLRKQRGLSQEYVSQKAGLTLKIVRNLERKQIYRCRPQTIIALSQFYGIESHILIAHDNKQSIKLLTTQQEIIDAHTHIATSAEKILVCTGSRSYDEFYFHKIEEVLLAHETLVHYRVLIMKPFKLELQEHLLRLLKTRDSSKSYRVKTLHIGLYEDTIRLPEFFICANEHTVSIIQPSMFSVNECRASFLIEDPTIALEVVAFIKNLYQFSKPIETDTEILSMGLFKA